MNEKLQQELNKIAGLEDGWFDGDGKAFTKEHIDRVSCYIEGALAFYDIEVPWLVPSPDGDIRAEWINKTRTTLIVFPSNSSEEPYGFSCNPDTSEEVKFGTDPFATTGAGDIGKWIFNIHRDENGCHFKKL
jgi:hypothetical protein